MNHVIDLLPIVRPLEDTEEKPLTWFYDNVASKLLPDILRMQSNGIPIQLNKVRELEDTVVDILHNVENKLSKNPMVLRFLEASHKQSIKDTSKEIALTKSKSIDDFYRPYDSKNTVHRTHLVNFILKKIGEEDKVLDKWTIRDLKKLIQIISNPFLESLAKGEIKSFMESDINEAMKDLAKLKANIYNKSHVVDKIEELKKSPVRPFTPSSSAQKRDFFSFYGIESEQTTKANQAKWDRDEIQRIQKEIEMLLSKES